MIGLSHFLFSFWHSPFGMSFCGSSRLFASSSLCRFLLSSCFGCWHLEIRMVCGSRLCLRCSTSRSFRCGRFRFETGGFSTGLSPSRPKNFDDSASTHCSPTCQYLIAKHHERSITDSKTSRIPSLSATFHHWPHSELSSAIAALVWIIPYWYFPHQFVLHSRNWTFTDQQLHYCLSKTG